MNQFRNALRLDKENSNVKLIHIEEIHGSNICFAICSFIAYAMDKKANICLVLLHNSLSHYRNICFKLGYNLQSLINNGQIRVITMENIITEKLMSDEHSNQLNLESPIDITSLYNQIIQRLEKMKYEEKLSYIITEDVSSLLVTKGIKECVLFVKKLQRLAFSNDLKLVISSHISKFDRDQKILSACLKHMADVAVQVSPLETGFSTEITGHIRIVDRDSLMTKKRIYQYKLTDRQIIMNPVSSLI